MHETTKVVSLFQKPDKDYNLCRRQRDILPQNSQKHHIFCGKYAFQNLVVTILVKVYDELAMFKTKEERVPIMKKAKLTLGLVAGLVATIGLSSCNEVTYNQGVVLTYTDAKGNKVDYTAAELFADYQTGSGAAGTDFQKVYETLIRNYYNSDAQKTALVAINKEATNQVNGLKTQAENSAKTNGTSYQVEFEKILDTNHCDNVDELFNLMQFNVEKEKFQNDYYTDYLDAIRDGVYKKDSGTHKAGDAFFPASATYGEGDEGWLKEKMPYHVRHILVKVSASGTELTEGTITSKEATHIGNVVQELAGADEAATNRISFGDVAKQLSEDGSATSYGDLGVMDLDQSYVNEFKLGIYAYDAIYNQTISDYRTANKATLLPPSNVVIDTVNGKKSINQYFAQGETYDDGNTGIGQIPYGAAVALLNAAEVDGSSFDHKINLGNDVFYPRNVIFNKYFNKHNVCVITPNEIAYNDHSIISGTANPVTGYVTDEQFNGKYSAAYATLPGFKTDTSAILPSFNHNVLTDSEGQVVLAVRAGTTGSNSYQGIHFIVLQRSAFNEFGDKLTTDPVTGAITKVEEQVADVSANADIPTLSQYWATKDPTQDGYPTYTVGTTTSKMTTYINFLHQDTSSYKSRRDAVIAKVKGYNGNIDTFMFQQLIENGSITFANAEIGKTIASYVKQKRETAAYNNKTSWDETWKTYAEYLVRQDYDRKNEDGTGKLISETCAIGYTNDNLDAKDATGLWAKGGACYGK